MRKLLAALVLLAALAAGATGLEPTKAPVSPAGTPAVIDLPGDQHIRNTGGMGRGGPGTGAGLCVPTSIQVAARWHGLTQMEGYQRWCMSREGGSYPQKTAKDIKEFCASKGVPVPPYVQSTGGDAKLLERIYKTRRMPAQTWTKYHMVSGAHLDGKSGAVIDNNRPGNWLWQSRQQYLADWKADGQGWVFVWLAPPPPPAVGVPSPVKPVDEPLPPRPCPGPNCPRWQTVTLGSGEVLLKLYAANGKLLGALLSDGWHPGVGDGWLKEASGDVPTDAPPPPVEVLPAIDVAKIDQTRPRYWIGEEEVTQAEAMAAVGEDIVPDDSDRYHLSVVADGASVAPLALADPKLSAMLARCHVQVYGPDSWVARTRLSARVTLQEPAPKGGKVLFTDDGTGDLYNLLRPHLDPTWKPEPPPAPPAPPEPDKPAPPAPKPDVKPSEEPKDVAGWIVALLASILAAYRGKE